MGQFDVLFDIKFYLLTVSSEKSHQVQVRYCFLFWFHNTEHEE